MEDFCNALQWQLLPLKKIRPQEAIQLLLLIISLGFLRIDVLRCVILRIMTYKDKNNEEPSCLLVNCVNCRGRGIKWHITRMCCMPIISLVFLYDVRTISFLMESCNSCINHESFSAELCASLDHKLLSNSAHEKKEWWAHSIKIWPWSFPIMDGTRPCLHSCMIMLWGWFRNYAQQCRNNVTRVNTYQL